MTSARSAKILKAMECNQVRPMGTTPEAMLEELNGHYDRAFQIYRACGDLDHEIEDAAIARSVELAETHALRAMRDARTWANLIVPSTVRGFALKARLFTDNEPSEWLNIKEEYQIVGLISQLLSAAGLAPIASLGDRMADDLIEDAAKGIPFDFPDTRAQ